LISDRTPKPPRALGSHPARPRRSLPRRRSEQLRGEGRRAARPGQANVGDRSRARARQVHCGLAHQAPRRRRSSGVRRPPCGRRDPRRRGPTRERAVRRAAARRPLARRRRRSPADPRREDRGGDPRSADQPGPGGGAGRPPGSPPACRDCLLIPMPSCSPTAAADARAGGASGRSSTKRPCSRPRGSSRRDSPRCRTRRRTRCDGRKCRSRCWPTTSTSCGS
jgi:hypothetical protein